jgi:hypothetical protein
MANQKKTLHISKKTIKTLKQKSGIKTGAFTDRCTNNAPVP